MQNCACLLCLRARSPCGERMNYHHEARAFKSVLLICNSNDHIVYYVWLYRLLDQEYWKTAASVCYSDRCCLQVERNLTLTMQQQSLYVVCSALAGPLGPVTHQARWVEQPACPSPITHTHTRTTPLVTVPRHLRKFSQSYHRTSQTSRKDKESDRESRKYCA